jgi:hypothetical protein
MFKEVYSEELDLKMLQCSCGALVAPAEEKQHQCPPPPPTQAQQDLKQYDDDMKVAIETMGNESLELKERVGAVYLYDRMLGWRFQYQCRLIAKRFPDEIYRKVIRASLQKQLDDVAALKASVYDENDEMRAKGVSFSERKRFLEENKIKIAWCEEMEQKLNNIISRYRLKPYEEWIGTFGYQTMMHVGS